MSLNSMYTYRQLRDSDLSRTPDGGNNKASRLLKYYRRCQTTSNKLLLTYYRFLFKSIKDKLHIELYGKCNIGPGLYLGHPYNITINPKTVIGQNCNIHKGVTIGQENRGKRIGTPIIGNKVWIGVNSTIVGNINIGDDVLIAPNSYVNCDIPSHSIFFGNPCIIKPCAEATKGYINNETKI